ncbi:TPA: AAA family ATPase [Pseudomonas aeruginosa]|uniref:KAP family P-loop NTPase fold protein n=1 Tax=Pseudomonadaceae TaxID=135621 RepID=UPI000D3DBDF2|nr:MULTISPECIES: P-loop NTPase fold protein [Pseudomonadaceae]EJB8514457.1 AAA family ATPase [Pseudomonas aeruginosa]MBG6433744.1 AAA family ATPase [Pseudomonas aeruginosa]MBH3519051.1 AAA family ATPase [Pseudomonas aeruginosa]MBH3741801.1 AAA family ATPase [Pseudomonas aeruginosa]MBH9087248.1 AAA family ATPase [Pseudomonas aeruginosa]
MTALSADRPGTDPKDDLFGHAPFAKSLADSICRYQGSDGLVLALYGPWGSGKSTVLNYVQHFLEQRPEDEQPVLVKFNPWWFSGQENLARAFLGQLQAVLPARSEKFKQLGDLLADFAEGVGGLIDLTGVSGGAGGLIGKLLGQAKRKPKDVPALKDSITGILQKAGKRILVIIDDIDRLTPEETRQLFTVIKALADFPNVIYLLAFDRDVAAQAIEQQSGLPGERYLEKIIQVPFELPPVDRVALRAALSKRLDEILADVPEGSFDQSYWTNVYHDGIDALIQVPRDVVRFTNTLAVTYPAVRGEVNAVDFIALEALRVFLPGLYDVIRTNPDRFSGHSRDSRYGADERTKEAFHTGWAQALPDQLQESSKALIERIFPKTGRMGYGSDWLAEWRRNLRACHPDVFPIYFRLTVPPGAIRRGEMMALLSLAASPADFGNALVQAREERRPDGMSKVRALLERLMDHVEKDIPDAHIPTVIQALFDVGDALIDPADERGMFDFGNVSRASRPVYHLLKRLSAVRRADVLEAAMRAGRAVAVQSWLLKALDEEVEKAQEATLLTADEVIRLKSVWLERIRVLAGESGFMGHPELPRLLATWKHWGEGTEVRAWCDRVTTSDEGLLNLLPKFLQHTRSQTMGDWAVRLQPRLNPSWLESYIDTAVTAARLQRLQRDDTVPDGAREAVSQYLTEFEMLQSGKDPDGIGAFDD